MKKEIVHPGQSLVDLAIQHYGSPEGVFFLLADNPNTYPDLFTNPVEGTTILVREETDQDQAPTINYFSTRNIKIVTGKSGTGIGNTSIGSTFIIS